MFNSTSGVYNVQGIVLKFFWEAVRLDEIRVFVVNGSTCDRINFNSDSTRDIQSSQNVTASSTKISNGVSSVNTKNP